MAQLRRSLGVLLVTMIVVTHPVTAGMTLPGVGQATAPVSLSLATAVENPSGSTIIVNKSDPGAYDSIQNAIENATAGAIINVTAGTYNETVIINKSVTLIGDPGDKRPGPGAGAPELDSDGTKKLAFNLVNGVTNVTITGFEIREYTANGIRAGPQATANITIRENHIHRIAGTNWPGGIATRFAQAGDHRRWRITKNIIANVSFASIHLANARHSIVSANEITGGRNLSGGLTTNSTTGIIVQSRSKTVNNRVTNITVRNNTITGVLDNSGIQVLAWNQTNTTSAHIDNITIRGNTIQGVREKLDHSGAVAVFQFTRNASIADITVTANAIQASARGVYSSEVAGIEITHNRISGVGHGIQVQSSSQVQISRNRIIGTTDVPGHHTHSAFGAAVIAGDSGNVSRVNISDNEMTGTFTQFGGVINLWVFADRTNASINSAIVTRNHLSGTFNGSPGTRGINVFASGTTTTGAFGRIHNVTISENTVSGANAAGVGLGGRSAHAVISDVLVTENRVNRSGNGVKVLAKTAYRIRSVRIQDNRLELTTNGVQVTADGTSVTTNITIFKNAIHNTTGTSRFSGDGIEFLTLGNATQRNAIIEANIVSNTTRTGVNVVALENGTQLNTTINQNLVEAVNGTGINVLSFNHARVGQIRISENRVRTTAHTGISAAAYRNASLSKITIRTNTLNHTDHDGIFIRSQDVANTSNVTITSNRVNDAKAGITVDSNGNATTQDITVTSNRVRRSQFGLFLHARDAGHLTDLNVTGNALRNNSDEGVFLGPIENGSVDHIRINRNTITNNTEGGIRVTSGTAIQTIQIHENRISGNSPFGLRNEDLTTLNATRNYWGASDGPSGDFNGSGDAVVGNVTIHPYYTDANLTTLSTQQDAADLYLGSGPASTSTNVTIPVTIENASNVAGFETNITFDPDVIQVQDVRSGPNFASPLVNINNTAGWVQITASQPNGTSAPLTLVNLVIIGTGQPGNTSPLAFKPSETKVFNDKPNNSEVPVLLHDSEVTITAVTKGDVNGDGTINTGDVIQVQRSIVGLSTSSSFSPAAADVNSDGSVNTGDVIQIQRFIVGLSSVLD